MEIENIIQRKKEFYSSLLDYIETTEDDKFDILIETIQKLDILCNKDEVISVLNLISKISDEHQRSSDFFNKIHTIIQYIIKEKRSLLLDHELYQIFRNNKRLLLLLFEHKLIQLGTKVESEIMSKKDANNFPYRHYLYSAIKSFISENDKKQFEKEIVEQYGIDITTFEEKCQIGENDAHICSLIRQDSVEEFISYVNKNNIPLSGQIKKSIFETNLFLIQKVPTLLEYAAFYGSIQIIQYLRFNNVPLPASLWLYAIHSNSAGLIHFLEENEIEPENFNKNTFLSNKNKNPYESIYKESIKCHHNAVGDYIKDIFLTQLETDSFEETYIQSCNYYYYPNDIGFIISRPRIANGFCISGLCSSLTKISIPSSVTSIGKSAFSGCSSIKQIEIPSSVTKIESYAFSSCSSLEQIEIPSSVVEIGDGSISRCKSLVQIVIPSSVTSIGNIAFNECTSLKQVSFSTPSSVTVIGRNAFAKCTSLVNIEIPPSVSVIGMDAFSGCSSLVQIEIPSVKTLGSNAFSECSSLTEIKIISSLISIDDHTFLKCSKLTKVSIPSSVTTIGNYSFFECTSLVQITIPSSVTSIGSHVFSNCTQLEQVEILSSSLMIGDSAFCECSKLKKIKIPFSVTNIGYFVFSKCTSLTQFVIPYTVTSIGTNSFSFCSSLVKMVIPLSVNTIGNSAFAGCSSLKEVIFAEMICLKSIQEFAFKDCSSLKKILIPPSVVNIGHNAFNGCSSLVEFSFLGRSSIKSIGDKTFLGCKSLTHALIPSSIESIGEFAFGGCSSLVDVSIPTSNATIGYKAFNECTSLNRISLPSSISRDWNRLGINPNVKIFFVV